MMMDLWIYFWNVLIRYFEIFATNIGSSTWLCAVTVATVMIVKITRSVRWITSNLGTLTRQLGTCLGSLQIKDDSTNCFNMTSISLINFSSAVSYSDCMVHNYGPLYTIIMVYDGVYNTQSVWHSRPLYIEVAIIIM